MPIPFATVTDPLGGSTSLVQCIDDGGIGGFEPSNEAELPDSNGYPKQWDVRGLKTDGTVRYNPLGVMALSAGTLSIGTTAVFWFGQTCSTNYVVRAIKKSKTNKDHDTFDVEVKGVLQKTLTHTWPVPA